MNTYKLEVDYNFKYFLMLLESVLNEKPAPLAEENVDWNVIYNIAVDHSLAGILYFAIEKFPESKKPRGDFCAYLKQMYQEQIVADLNLTVETERILNLLSSENICCMPVKGIITKSNYPQPHLRTMTDVDILCKPEDRISIEKIMRENGYTQETVGVKDSSFRKDEILHFEMHSHLLTEASPAYSYFEDVWSRAVFRSGSRIADMSLEDSYLFMVEHLAEHTLFGGAGIRMYMDVYLFLKKHGDRLNRAYVDSVLQNISLSDFERKAVRVCNNWFSGNEEIDYTSPVSNFVLNSCTFGRASISLLSDTLRNYKGGSSLANGVKRIFKKLFPSVKWMRLRYKAVDKFPFAYIFFVPVHWIDRLFFSRNVNTLNIGGYFMNDSSQQADELRKIYGAFGLEERI